MSIGYTPYSGNGQLADPKAPLMPPKPVPGAPGFSDPTAAGSGWTGVSSNADPYGIHGVGYNLESVAGGGFNDDGTPATGNLSREQLLKAGGYQAGEGIQGSGNQSNTSFAIGAMPDSQKFSGYTKWENQNAPDGSALGSDGAQIQAQTQNAQSNLSQYPAYGNQYGLGGAITPPASGAPNPAQSDYSGGQGVTVNVPDTSSRGFNPWSIQGESNARDTSKGVSI